MSGYSDDGLKKNFPSSPSPGSDRLSFQDNGNLSVSENAVNIDTSSVNIDLNINQSSTSNSTTPSFVKNDAISWWDVDVHKKSNLTSTLRHTARKSCKKVSLKESFLSFIPLFERLGNYNWKKDLITDITAGITISILHIPQGIAYSFLIGISPVYGLYVSFFPVLIYAFMGTAQHISIGTMAVVDMMLSQIVKEHHPTTHSGNDLPNMTIDDIATTMSTHHGGQSYHYPSSPIETLTSICILTGLIQLAMGFLRMGAISLILSDQLVSGFSCGAALHVVGSQLPSVFDIHLPPGKAGPFQLIYEIIETAKHLNEINYATLTMSMVVFCLIISFKELLEPQIQKIIPTLQMPFDLIIVVGSTVVSSYMNLNKSYSVPIMGDVPTGLPMPSLPRFDFLPLIASDALILAVVSFAVNLSLGKIYAKKHGYTVLANQEFIAIGTANVISSFFGCFPATASLSRTSIMGKSARTQVSSIVSSGVLLLVLLYFAPFLFSLPQCVVAVVIIIAQKSLLWQVTDFKKAWNVSRNEGFIWLVTFISVVLFGIDVGLIAGALFSVFSIIIRFYSPKLRLLGQLPYTEIFLDIKQHSTTREIPGIKIFQFSSPLFFMNKEMFQDSVFKKTLRNQKFQGCDNEYGRVECVVIDCSAMSFIDSAGVEAVAEIANELHVKRIQVSLAACPPSVLSMLMKMNFFQLSPFTLIFPSVHDAISKINSPRLTKKISIQL